MRDSLESVNAALGVRFSVQRVLGRGGMATVYLARDLAQERSVALKVLDPALTATIGKERFLREIQISAQLTHPHILPLHESGDAAGLLYYVMPYVEGESLRDRLNRERQLQLEDAVQIGREVADALSYAHSHGVLHRDIKPENILLEAGHAVVSDFGIARAITAASGGTLTEVGVAVGTPSYMSPEQACAQPEIDGRSDIYSLGCVMYEMLVGELPFTGPDAQTLLARRFADSVRPVRQTRSAVPQTVADAVEKALARVPADRFATAAELRAALLLPATATPPSQVALPLTESRAGAGRRSIAVLSFTNMSADPDNEYFSDGLAEELINALAQLEEGEGGEGGGLHVASRTSSFRFKGKNVNIRRIGRELGVDAVLEGSVRRSGNRLRITAQLVDVANGYQLWSGKYDRALEDVFAIQEEIAQTIVDRLKVKLIAEQPARIVQPPTKNLEAYTLYLKGRFFWNKRTDENFIKATESFELAVEKDAQYALAYAGLADAYALLGIAEYGLREPHSALPKAREAARMALTLNEALAESYTTLGHIAAFYDWNWDAAERLFRQAVEGNPRYAMAYHWCALYHAAMERHDEALAEEQRARELEPLSLIINKNVGTLLYYRRRHDAAIDVLLQTLHLEPSFVRTRFYLGLAYQEVGMVDAAVAQLRECVELTRGNSVCEALLGHALARAGQAAEARATLTHLRTRAESSYVPALNYALVHLGLGEVDEAFAFLQKACDERSSWLVSLKVEPLFDPIREDSRFADLVARVGLR